MNGIVDKNIKMGRPKSVDDETPSCERLSKRAKLRNIVTDGSAIHQSHE
ncbi:hypothetical protein [Flagellimonas hadalis]|nr:hypothetical protein [Allomuricauda hadalis]